MNCRHMCFSAFCFAVLFFVYGCACVGKQADYECAERTLNIGPFEYEDEKLGVILNDLFQAANAELAMKGYDRSLAIVVRDFGNEVESMNVSILIPRRSIRDVMLLIGEHIGLNVKFERGQVTFFGKP